MWITIMANIPYICYFVYMLIIKGHNLKERTGNELMIEYIFNATIEIGMIILIPFAIKIQLMLQELMCNAGYFEIDSKGRKTYHLGNVDSEDNFEEKKQYNNNEENKNETRERMYKQSLIRTFSRKLTKTNFYNI